MTKGTGLTAQRKQAHAVTGLGGGCEAENEIPGLGMLTGLRRDVVSRLRFQHMRKSKFPFATEVETFVSVQVEFSACFVGNRRLGKGFAVHAERR